MPGEAAFPRMIPGGDPFPLPLKQVERPSCKISRRASQRLARRRRELELVNLGIGTLNWMAGTPSQGSFEPSNLQTEMVERVVKLASDSFKLEGGFSSPPTPEAALTELLRGADDYSGPASTLAAYHRERVSMPDSLHNSPALSELLPEDALHFLEAPERMLRTEEDVDCDVVPYWDATLRNNPRAYKDPTYHRCQKRKREVRAGMPGGLDSYGGGTILDGYRLKHDDLIWPMLFSDRSHPVVIKAGMEDEVTNEFYARGLDLHPGATSSSGIAHPRPLLSIFDRTYKFIKRHYDAKADWTRTWNKVATGEGTVSSHGRLGCRPELPGSAS